ncbi:glycosyltransferase family 4 protein [Pseudosporangium ferrugineum]|uniref:Glycosyltransferase involved in cell wall biosynthesis n=1 Tax=Pseudosporangium ferrugineum TaxID=439699 RepID=A0A2T0RDS6_9ACTN|nr:glycosyltransferase family 4 protein [Pseudosporangium ferrugineum]PRY19303.1 glycosyltransferase involved in cell wall biosynthesis [Pseudosporangium ferrugineum]
MRIGIISQWYDPEPVVIPGNLAEDLVSRGHEVRVLTGFPNYPEGKIYPGYQQRWNDRSRQSGATVRRVPLYASHDASGAHRAANFLSFSATSSLAAWKFLAGVDVVYVYLTPATAFAAAAMLKALRGIPVVIHVQDIWPESVTSSAMAPSGRVGRTVERSLHAVMRRIYRASSGIAVIAPTMRDMIVARGADPRRTRVILNWADEKLFRPVDSSEHARRDIGRRDRCTIMYAGTMGPFQNIEGAVRAAASLADRSEIDLVLAGSGTAEQAARDLTRDLGADNIRFLGRRPIADMAALYAAADFQLVSLRNLPIFQGTIPSKLQSALACGSPVVVSVPGDCAELVETNGVGLACPPDDWRLLADRFRQAAKIPADEHAEMTRRAHQVYQTRMSRQAGVDQLEDMLIEAAVTGRREP